ncbi:MAG: metalloenzyme [Meiothermus sp.]|uniref:metalloenzyme n=1 Tax=Meiothermus sp. TaxID=1955249 RepID=UPI0025ED368D|nr:metalloenzyme [Meiothermus sp.]MDW8217544.1 metalloenzyme [Acidobacteriota bacterium]MCS7057433.1 metalloenzyme [Meiothermus sp.]MCS7193541.1 metalloenzyme [Meiothermus sp.]MCX7739982.1 metalloenzyme [Meiothermus sp.]MDW8091612.1 metalloenzyme [Meiothermus sp.]
MLAFLFVDGLGLSRDPRSPLQRLELPTLKALSQGFGPEPADRPGQAYRVLDAGLGVEGLPQSGTGQTTLLTGRNAARMLGFHQGPHPLRSLQALLAQESLQVWARRQGLRVLHANGYRPEYLERAQRSRRNLLSAFGYAARCAGLELLPAGHPLALPPAFWNDPKAAGRRFAELAQEHHLTILENWALDYAAHRAPDELEARFSELDRFVEGFLEAAPAATLVIAADHGNAEEPWHPQHTRNPVPLLVCGPLATTVPPMRSLTELAPWVREQLKNGGAGGRI